MNGLYLMPVESPKDNATLFAAEGYSGVLISVGMGTINPKKDEFDFSPIDDILSQVTNPAWGIGLAIAAGQQAPDWLKNDASLPSVSVSVNDKPKGPASQQTLPLQWSSQYVAYCLKVMEQLAAHLGSTGWLSRVRNVRHNMLSSLDCEGGVRWCDSNGPNMANAAAYLAQHFDFGAVEATWMDYTDALMAEFPEATIIQSWLTPKVVMPWIADGAVSNKDTSTANVNALMAAAGEAFGENIMFLDTALSTVPPDDTFINTTATGSLLGFQLNVWGGSKHGTMTGPHTDPTPGTAEGYIACVQNGIKYGAKYIESHGIDGLLYPTAVKQAAMLLQE